MKQLPAWLCRKVSCEQEIEKTEEEIVKHRLHTVCEEASCPNLLECYSQKTATFLLLGKQCTRACGFCAIEHASSPGPVEESEIGRVVEASRTLGLKHIVLTMVTRDDLPDGGASHIAKAIGALRQHVPQSSIEVLISDFQGCEASIQSVLDANPDVLNHNMETVSRLTPFVRHKATYQRSLFVLRYAKEKRPDLLTKSGLMVGLGETKEEVCEVLSDLHRIGVSSVTIGQYLQPSKRHLPVKEFVPPEQFTLYKEAGLKIGLKHVLSGPFVRSSYHAAKCM